MDHGTSHNTRTKQIGTYWYADGTGLTTGAPGTGVGSDKGQRSFAYTLY